MSIKARLIITLSILIAIAFAVIGVVTIRITEARMIDRIDDSLVSGPKKPPPGVPERWNEDDQDYGSRATAILFFDADGQLVSADASGPSSDPDPLPDIRESDLEQYANEIFSCAAVGGSNGQYRVYVQPLDDGGFLAEAAPLADVNATIHNLTVVVLIIGTLVIVAVIVLVWATIRRGLRPIDDIIDTAGLIAAGDLSHRVQIDGTTSEVKALGDALNEMLAQIEASFAAKDASEQRLRQFVADASHELRTPLTSIRGYAELFQSGSISDPESLSRAMMRIESEGKRMSKLVEDLLTLARLDQGQALQFQTVNLTFVAADAVASARVVAPDREFQFNHPDEALVNGDPDALRQVIDNLLANARIHTTDGAPVEIRVAHNADQVVLSITDQGPGMDSTTAAKVFDRFYRADPSRERLRGGTGLGLSIVASIVEVHNGKISLESSPETGTTVTVSLQAL